MQAEAERPGGFKAAASASSASKRGGTCLSPASIAHWPFPWTFHRPLTSGNAASVRFLAAFPSPRRACSACGCAGTEKLWGMPMPSSKAAAWYAITQAGQYFANISGCVRCGASDLRCVTVQDLPLNDKGQQQAVKLGEALAGFKFDVIASSDL